MFKKKEKTMKEPKEKKVRTMKVGTHKKSVLLLWAVLLASTSFGVYKNFTAIDTHTVHEKEIIQLKLNDTNGIENFVKNFAKAYYSWDTSKEAIEARTTEISKYLTKELQDLNADTIRTDIPTSATVTNVLVWNVKPVSYTHLDWSMIRSIQTTYIQSIRFPTISLISMWTIAGLGYRGTGWTALENQCSTGFTVSQILSGQSACILAMPQDMWCNRRISWTSSMTWQTVSGKVSRHLPE